MAQFIANSYITLYRQQKNITRGKLTTAVPVSQDVQKKMLQMVEGRTKGNVEFITEVNPDILGGFVLEYDTYRLDTSVKTQLNNIQKKLS
jgi:F-type H+-transporting ATPase subunit delta